MLIMPTTASLITQLIKRGIASNEQFTQLVIKMMLIDMGSPAGEAGITEGWEKIVDEELLANATDITITGLDLDADKAYMIICTIKNPQGSNSGIYLYYNNDTTIANYTQQWLRADNTTITAQRQNQPYFVYVHAGQNVLVTGFIMRSPDGYPIEVLFNADNVTAGMRIFNRVVFWNNTNNVTRIDIHALVANAIGIGSKLLIFKVI